MRWYEHIIQCCKWRFILCLQVHKALYNGEMVAAKILNADVLEPWAFKLFQEEVSTMASINSRYITIPSLIRHIIDHFFQVYCEINCCLHTKGSLCHYNGICGRRDSLKFTLFKTRIIVGSSSDNVGRNCGRNKSLAFT